MYGNKDRLEVGLSKQSVLLNYLILFDTALTFVDLGRKLGKRRAEQTHLLWKQISICMT